MILHLVQFPLRAPTRGFTILEIMVISGILGIAVAIAVASIGRPRTRAQTAACLNNLKQIESAKQQWATENNKQQGDTPEMWELLPYFKKSPECPGGGIYTINNCDTFAICSQTGHTM